MIRNARQADTSKIYNILKKITAFTGEEVDVAMELVNIATSNYNQTDYYLFVYEDNDKVWGYYCIGRRPLTDAVYDLYWIVADPDSDKKGIGKILLEHAEQFVQEHNGRWLIVETSSKESYSKARNFYMRNNYSIIAEINDFYRVGDNLVVFGKYFK
ncbi:MAG TPA: GNAT family N-acetyltransferase [Ignavibacteria bacterium]|nr:GNAT family N-acetyltransferase [Ignavibacteria bacterium]